MAAEWFHVIHAIACHLPQVICFLGCLIVVAMVVKFMVVVIVVLVVVVMVLVVVEIVSPSCCRLCQPSGLPCGASSQLDRRSVSRIVWQSCDG